MPIISNFPIDNSAALEGKQDKLTGVEGQIVGFDSNGNAIPQAAPNVGVTSFNERSGAVSPQAGDYTADMVGAIPSPTGGTAGQILTKTESGEAWQDAPSGLPDGGTEGQVLTQGANGPEWSNPPDTGVTTFNGRTGAVTPQAGDYSEISNEGSSVEIDSSGQITLYDANDEGIRLSSIEVYLGASDASVYVGGSTSNVTLESDRIRNIQAVSEPTDAVNKRYVDSKAPKAIPITIPATGWSNNTQTVTVNGVVSDESAQLIMPMPAIASQADYIAAGIYCSGQSANQLTFTCTTVPTNDISMYVVMQGVGA